MRKPRILLIGGDGGRSGVPRHIRQVVRATSQLAELTVASDKNKGGYDFLAESPARHVVVPGLRTSVWPPRWFRAARALQRVIVQEQPHLIWAHSRMGVLLLRLLAAGGVLPGNPELAVTFHGLPFGPGHRRWASALAIRVERLLLRVGPRLGLVFLSTAAEELYRQEVGAEQYERHRVFTQPNCADLGALSSPDQRTPDRDIIMTGRDAWQKDLARALRIFAALPGSYRLTLCGPGTDHSGFRVRARRILGPGPLSRVRFMGEVSDIRPLLANADAYLLTSRYEGMPIGALEAFEAGLPVALSAIRGTEEIRELHPFCTELSGGTGPDDAQEDALRLVSLTEAYRADPIAARRDIRGAFQKHFSFPEWAQQMRLMTARLCWPETREGSDLPVPALKEGPPSGLEWTAARDGRFRAEQAPPPPPRI
ncbi:glycosyltransferase family 4 protein [Pseudooceanicola sp. HF7]|uniref:glycosyltransferase family 4 protein n=1 Tax=Pseudooceanicola sp. HF7 TaxID=2721560 RepID=UPI00143102BA|nr:glycosyltransferase family 4 protein [Pseudooceanicola sp. HF7]NIZ09139.1 glycosyltransferase family 4 protein [Pseudooceanicola sp. HF7]